MWGIADPAHVEPLAARQAAFETAYAELEKRITAFLKLPLETLSTAAMAAMTGRKACLLANHGMLVAGRDLDEALALAIELEELCGQYWRACQLGQPVLLSAEEMAAVQEKFAGYGQQ